MTGPIDRPPVRRSAWRATQGWVTQHWRALAAKFADLVDKDAAGDFKPDALAIEQAPLPIAAFSVLYTVIALVVIFVLWSFLGSVDRIVVAEGKIVTSAHVIVMQPFTTSRILKVHVKVGDHVAKGQSLISFDPAFAQADELSLAQKERALTAEIERIQAELSGAKSFTAGPDASPERRAEAALFAQRSAQFSSEMTVRDSREHQVQVQLDNGRKSIAGLQQQYEFAHKAADIRRALEEQHAGARLDTMSAESTEINSDLKLKETLAENARLEQQRAEIAAERKSYLDQWRADLNQKLVDAQKNAAEATEALNKARKMKDLTELRSPIDGIVLELADRSEGSVLREAETLITLVPANAALDLEADIPSRDVSYVAVGDAVRIKLEAYPFQRFGTLEGRLDVVSPDSIPQKEGEKTTNVVFPARIHLNQTAGAAVAQGIRLRPGLVATAEIKAGRRSIASYITDPILRTSDEGMREP